VQTALEYLDSLAKEAGNDVPLQQELATAYLRVGEVQGDARGPNLGRTKEALESYDKAIGLAAQINRSVATSREALRLLASGHMHRGDILVVTGRSKEGIAALEKAADFAERMLDAGTPDAEDYQTGIQVAMRLGDAIIDDRPARALEIYEHGRELAERLLARENSGRSKLGLVQAFQRIGRVSHALGNPVGGARNYRAAQRIVEELAQSDPNNARYRRDLMVIYNFLGNLNGNPRYFHLDDPKTALEYYRKAAALQEQLAAADPKNTQAVMDRALGAAKMSDVLRTIDTPESIRQGRLCSEHIRPLLEAAPDNHRYLRIEENCLESLGRALHFAGMHRESVEIFDKSLQIALSVLKRTPADLGSRESVSNGHAGLADSYLAAGDVAAAEKHLAIAFEMVQAVRKENPKDLYFLRDAADIEQSLGDLAAKRGERNLAARHYGNSLALWADWRKLAPDSPYLASKVRRVHEVLERSKARAGALR
ncbi:MAG: tetratricopeptide repeat protein, partial [Gammaproteobacteria bacterium]